jgi:integrase
MIKKSWWVDLRFNYTRHRKRSPENSRAGALAYEATLRQRLARGEEISGVEQDSVQDQVFERFAWRWFDEYVLSNNKYSERLGKKHILSASLVPHFGRLLVGQITTHHIEQYKAYLTREGLAAKTINNRLTVLNTCLRAGYDWLKIVTAPPKIKRLKCPPVHTDYLSVEESELLITQATGVLYELVLAGLRTGMRQGELKGLQWTSIDWQNRTLTVRHSRSDYTKKLESPKSNRERRIPLDLDLYEVLLRRKDGAGYVFTDSEQRPFDQAQMGEALTGLCKKVGLRRITWHVLRHTFASHLAMRGVPLNIVQALLGHSTISTTMRYAHVAPSTLRTAVDLLSPRTALSENLGQPVGNPWLELQRKAMARSSETMKNTENVPG